MDRLVVDSSVVVKWYVPESHSNIAQQLLDLYEKGELTFLAPDLLYAELGNIIWKKVRRQEITADDGQDIVQALPSVTIETTPVEELLIDAYRLAAEHDRTVYDALYLALSRREGISFITADQTLVRAVRRAIPNILYLGDWKRAGG